MLTITFITITARITIITTIQKYANKYTIAINTINTNNIQQGPHNLSQYTLHKQDILMLYPLIHLSPSLGTRTGKCRRGQEHTIDICGITVLSRSCVAIHL